MPFYFPRKLFLKQVERYAWHIVENGTIINEEVEVNVEDQTEVIRVPQHNDVDAVEVLNDFAAVSLEVLEVNDFEFDTGRS